MTKSILSLQLQRHETLWNTLLKINMLRVATAATGLNEASTTSIARIAMSAPVAKFTIAKSATNVL
jgi:hypothetical protein